jgi:hypothetical protein
VFIASLALAVSVGWVGCSGSSSTTVIQPPTPPGLPKARAIRIPNPPGAVLLPPIGNLIRMEKDPPPAQTDPTAGQPPFPEAVWKPGYWAWQNNQYTWIPGHWEQPPQGFSTWTPPRYEPREQGWVFYPGRWQ